MPTESAPRSSAAMPDGVVPIDGATAVFSCSRLGRTANPPTFSLTGWLRPRRRRCDSVSGA
ncbi:hypothetical protein L2K20_21385 [Mycobacterium sp. MBM]|nr:hypothetical protein [Mycobacterium sp. MBM]